MAEQGVVKWLTHDKGHGYIARDDGGMDVFFDHGSVAGGGFFALNEGDAVEFDLGDGAARPQARRVIKLGEGPLPDPPESTPEPNESGAPTREHIREHIDHILRQFD